MKINIHTSHPSAFISSTFLDLKPERAAVAEILRENGLNVNALDVQPASSGSSKNEILNCIKQSDFIILIIGNRYGSIMPEFTSSESASITLWEYQRAISAQKSILAYFKQSEGCSPEYSDNPMDENYNLKVKRLKGFKELVSKRHNPSYFIDEADLADKIQRALIAVYRDGVKKLLTTNNSLRNESEGLKAKLTGHQVPQTNATSHSSAKNRLLQLDEGLNVNKLSQKNALSDLFKDKK